MITDRPKFAAGMLAGLALAFVLATSPILADARVEQATTFDMPGAMGSMARMFSKGGDEGMVSLVLVQGDRKLERHGDTGNLIDLSERKVWQLDFRRKRYTVRTFDEIRQEMEQALARAGGGRADRSGAGPGDAGEDGTPDYEVTFDVTRTDETRTIQGHECHKMLVTITAKPREGSEAEGGAIRINAATWVGPLLAPLEEVAAFDRRYADALGLGDLIDGGNPRFASLQAMYPALAEGMKQLREHADDFDGSVLLTEVTIAAEGLAETAGDSGPEGEESDRPKMGRMFKKLGGMFGRKRREREREQAAAQGGEGGQGGVRTLMTTRTEVRSVGTDVAQGELAIPQGFRER